MRGDKKTPTALEVLKVGAKRAAKLIARQITTPGEISDAPDWMSDEQKLAWVDAIEHAPRHVLRRADKGTLAAYILAEDMVRLAAIGLQGGLVLKQSKTAIPRPSPYVAIMHKQAMLMMRAAAELGFTPCSRARIEAGVRTPQPKTDWDKVANG